MAEIIVNENGEVEESTIEKLKRKVQNRWASVKEFCKEHKEGVITTATIAVPTAIEIMKMIAKGSAKRAEEAHRTREIWDPEQGHWWKLKRELSSREQLELEYRVKNGESRGEVLEDMGVLRR